MSKELRKNLIRLAYAKPEVRAHLLPLLRKANPDGVDRSEHPTIVEYAVHMLFKGKSPASAVKETVKKHSGAQNMFFGPGVTLIDPKKLETALWDRLVDFTVKNIAHIKPGKEHFALGGTMQHFHQKTPSFRAELKKRIVHKLGHDPFQNDDGL